MAAHTPRFRGNNITMATQYINFILLHVFRALLTGLCARRHTHNIAHGYAV